MALALTCLAAAFAPGQAQSKATAPVAPAVTPERSLRVISTPLGDEVGEVDWSHRLLRVRSHGAPPLHAYVPKLALPFAQRRAEAMARAKLTALLRALPVGATRVPSLPADVTVGDVLQSMPKLLPLAQASTEQMRAVVSRYAADGGVELTAELPLDGGRGTPGPLWAAMWRSLHSGDAPDAVAWERPWAADGAPDRAAANDVPAPTGIVIVARVAAKPWVAALWPRIEDSAGRVVYDPGQVHPDIWQSQGLQAMTRSLSMALRDPRVAPHALVVQARHAPKQGGAVWVLEEADAARVRGLGPLLAEGRIALVIVEDA